MKKICIFCYIIAGLLLVSCIGLESKIKINNDGSGNIFFSYRISNMFLSMGESEAIQGEKNMPLPMSKKDFEKSIEGVEGLKVISVTQEEDDKDLIIKTEIEFKDIEQLSKTKAFSEWPIAFEKKGSKHIFKQLISEGTKDSNDEFDEDTMNIIETMFKDYELVFSVEAPSKITEYSMGEISENGKIVSYTIPIIDMLAIEESQELIIEW